MKLELSDVIQKRERLSESAYVSNVLKTCWMVSYDSYFLPNIMDNLLTIYKDRLANSYLFQHCSEFSVIDSCSSISEVFVLYTGLAFANGIIHKGFR